MPEMIQIQNPSSALLMSREKFAESVGVPFDVVRGWCQKDYLPTYRIGKYTLINLALLEKELLGE